MKIRGCKTKNKHLFVGSERDKGAEEAVSEVRYVGILSLTALPEKSPVPLANDYISRHDFYQTPTNVIASLYLKKIDKERAMVNFSSPTTISLDLPTADNKRYRNEIPLFGKIDPAQSKAKIMGTKLELTLVKLEGTSWPTLRSDEQRTSQIVQSGSAGIV